MAMFQYQALTQAGRLMTGQLEAGSSDEAQTQLGEMNLTVDSLQKIKKATLKTAVGRNEFLLFNQQLASITKAGIPLEQGLREVSRDIASPKMRKLIEEVAQDLESGMGIDEAFTKRERQFPMLYSRILKAGVETGRLSEMLTSLNRHIDLGNQTRRIIGEAVAYPGVILLFAAIILTGVFQFIIPQFESILSEMAGGRLNPITSAVLAIGGNVLPFWVGLVCAVGAVVLILTALSTNVRGRRFRESLLRQIPVVGRIYKQGTLGRFSEAMAILISSGSDMGTSLRLAAQTTSSEQLILESDLLADQMEQGQPVLEAGQFCRVIPRFFLYSIQLGMQRNELQDNLYSLSSMYSDQARQGQSRLQSVLLPAMVILVGGVVAVAILAMFLPMIQVVTSLSSAG
ncbi:MAG: type II secretion system F family protein [Phycisphaeraceae bacterium]|nr:type II secretion system F family protein [Phycisphaeraceae bacterium]